MSETPLPMHPRHDGKQKHEVTVEDVVRYELAKGCPREDLISRCRRRGQFSNVSQRRVDQALAAMVSPATMDDAQHDAFTINARRR
jgi:hypothetical protein